MQNRQWLDLALDTLEPRRADRVRVFRLMMWQGLRLRTLLDRKLAPIGITAQQGAILAWIEAQREPPTISSAAQGLAMTHQNVRQIAGALENKGLLRIAIDKEDRRVRRLVLTEKHRKLWKRRNPDDFAAVEAWMSAWTDGEVRQLLALLLRPQRHLDPDDAV